MRLDGDVQALLLDEARSLLFFGGALHAGEPRTDEAAVGRGRSDDWGLDPSCVPNVSTTSEVWAIAVYGSTSMPAGTSR
jgi:hypothetical protein